jgi:hypothetical protein
MRPSVPFRSAGQNDRFADQQLLTPSISISRPMADECFTQHALFTNW